MFLYPPIPKIVTNIQSVGRMRPRENVHIDSQSECRYLKRRIPSASTRLVKPELNEIVRATKSKRRRKKSLVFPSG